MKVAIITYSWSQNWGAVLQAYALTEHIISMGNDAWLINYQNFDNRLINTVKSIPDGIYDLLSVFKNRKRVKKFNDFRNNYLRLTDKCINSNDLKKLNDKFDAFITGSDQVWNVGFGVCKDFYLEFANDSLRRISYAASFGVSEIPVEHRNDTILGIKNIEYLSVREKSGAQIVRELTNREAKVVLDPVFLLSKEEWQERVGTVTPIIKDKYIFVYPTQISKQLVDTVNRIKRLTGCKVISPFYAFGWKTIKDIGPLDFINYIANASYVVTSSFHATAFSIIFNKKLLVVPHNKTGSRVIDLLESLGLKNQCIIKDDVIEKQIKDNIDYKEVNIKLKKQIWESKDFLENALR